MSRCHPYHIRHCFFAIIGIFFNTYIFTQSPDTIFITSGFKQEYFGSKCVHFYQASKIKNPQILEGGTKVSERNHRLKTNQYNVLKVKVVNLSPNDQSLLLFLHNVQIDVADVLLFEKNKFLYQSPETGCTIAGFERPNSHRTLALPLIFKPGLVYDMYIRVYRQEFGITVSPHLVHPVTGIDFRWTDICFLIVISSCIFLSFLGLVLYYYGNLRRISQKDTLVFVIYSILTALYVIAASGYGSLYIWGSSPVFEVNAAIFFGALSGSAFMYLCSLILKIKHWNKWLGIWFDAVSIIYISVSLLGFLLYHHYLRSGLLGSLLSLLYFLVIINMIVIFILTIRKIWVDKEKNYYWFLFIFFFYIIYTIIVIALEVGAIRYNFEFHALRIVSAHFPQLILLLIFLIKRMWLSIESNVDLIANMRKEITQDIHDEIGSTLTKISLHARVSATKFEFSDAQRQLFSKIEDYAVDANQKLRYFLLSISPRYDTLDYTIQGIREIFIKQAYNFEHNFEAKINHPEMELSNTIKNQWMGMFEEMMELISKKSEIQKVHLSVHESIRQELCFLWIFQFNRAFEPHEIEYLFDSAKMLLQSLRIQTSRADEMKVEFFINLQSKKY